MKKVLIILFSILCSVNVLAQDTIIKKHKVRLGFRAQPIFNWLQVETKNFSSNGVGVGGKIGLLLDWNFGKNYALSTGMDFVMLGGGISANNPVYKVNIVSTSIADTIILNSRKYKLQYLDFPLTVKLKTNQIGNFTYFVQLGGTLGINISAKSEDRGTHKNFYIGSEQYSEKVKLKTGLGSSSEIKLIRAEVCLGIGTEWAFIGNMALMMGVSYHKGLTNVYNGKNQNLTENTSFGNYKNVLSQRATASYVALDLVLLF